MNGPSFPFHNPKRKGDRPMKRAIAFPKRNKYYASLIFHAWSMNSQVNKEAQDVVREQWNKGYIALLIDERLTLAKVEDSFKESRKEIKS